MKINSVTTNYNKLLQPSQTNHTPSFKGEFVSNNALKDFISYAKTEDLLRFKEILKYIKTVPDDAIFWVDTRWTNCTLEGKTFYNIYKQIGQNKRTRKRLNFIDEEKTPSSSRLAMVNKELDKFYKGKIKQNGRSNLRNEVKELLVENKSLAQEFNFAF